MNTLIFISLSLYNNCPPTIQHWYRIHIQTKYLESLVDHYSISYMLFGGTKQTGSAAACFIDYTWNYWHAISPMPQIKGYYLIIIGIFLIA